jgi:HprK-related kinase A
MTLGELPAHELSGRLRSGTLGYRLGPFTVRVRSPFEEVCASLRLLYPDFALSPPESADFDIAVAPPPTMRRWVRPQAVFYLDDEAVFLPFPRRHAAALLEWGINWCVARRGHQFLMVHAAVVARGDVAVILPAPPGSGKSTLCAALVQRDWRLLSDEFALIEPSTGALMPMPRPVALKERSIGIIGGRVPGAVFGPTAQNSEGQLVAHLRPPPASVAAAFRPASPRWVVFPRYRAGAPLQVEPVTRARALVQLAESSFNYNVLGTEGFRRLVDVIERSDCYRLTFGDLDHALAALEALR